jgi:hypothetical protein
MPRKTSKGGKPVDAAGTELKAVRLELTLEAHKLLRVEAAKEGMSMASLVRRLVEEYLAVRWAPVAATYKGKTLAEHAKEAEQAAKKGVERNHAKITGQEISLEAKPPTRPTGAKGKGAK